MTTEYYTAEEAMKVLDKPRSTFFKEVEQGIIPSILEEGKKRGRRYPKEAIDFHAELERRKVKKQPTHLTFLRATNADIWEAVENARQTYGDDDIIPYNKAMEWRLINDEMSMSIKDSGRFAGCTTIMPLDEDIILALLQDRIREKDIPSRAIKKWTDPKLCAYIASIAIVPTNNEERNKERGRFLLKHTIKWAITLYHQYDIRKFYGIGTTPTGQKILERLGFKEVTTLEGGARKGYVLEDKKEPTKLLGAFLEELENH